MFVFSAGLRCFRRMFSAILICVSDWIEFPRPFWRRCIWSRGKHLVAPSKRNDQFHDKMSGIYRINSTVTMLEYAAEARWYLFRSHQALLVIPPGFATSLAPVESVFSRIPDTDTKEYIFNRIEKRCCWTKLPQARRKSCLQNAHKSGFVNGGMNRRYRIRHSSQPGLTTKNLSEMWSWSIRRKYGSQQPTKINIMASKMNVPLKSCTIRETGWSRFILRRRAAKICRREMINIWV